MQSRKALLAENILKNNISKLINSFNDIADITVNGIEPSVHKILPVIKS